MKKLAWLPLLLVALSCANRSYQINGIYSAPDGTEVYLIDSPALTGHPSSRALTRDLKFFWSFQKNFLPLHSQTAE